MLGLILGYGKMRVCRFFYAPQTMISSLSLRVSMTWKTSESRWSSPRLEVCSEKLAYFLEILESFDPLRNDDINFVVVKSGEQAGQGFSLTKLQQLVHVACH